MPLFLRNAFFINVPLETSYQQTWDVLPIELKRTIATSSSRWLTRLSNPTCLTCCLLGKCLAPSEATRHRANRPPLGKCLAPSEATIGSGPLVVLRYVLQRSFNPCCFGSLVRALVVIRLHKQFFRCFNPCCFGSLVRAGCPSCVILPIFRFQSLLFWIIGSGLSHTEMKSADHWFQSLLFWIIGSGNL